MRVTVHGREAHIGLMHQGRNAFEDAIHVVTRLQRLARRVGRRRTRFSVRPEAARRSLMLIGAGLKPARVSTSFQAAVCSRWTGG